MANRLQVLAAALALLACSARAAEVDVRLERVTLYQLTRLVLGELLHEPYVVDGSLIASEDLATVDVRHLEHSQARALLERLLLARGYALEYVGGITEIRRLEKAAEVERLLVYRPRYRSVAYLQGAARSFVAKGRFAGGGASGVAAAGQESQPQAAGQRASRGQPQTAVSGVVPAQGAVIASQDVLIFEGPESEAVKLERLVAELDEPAREAVVRAYVFEVGSSETDGSAVSLAVNLLGGKASAAIPAAGLPFSVGVRVAGIEAAYSVLQGDSRFKVISSPTIRIRSGERAKLSVGSEVPVLGAVSLSATGQPVQSVDYRQSGVILELTPEILRDVVTLTLQQQVSSFVNTTTGVNGSPTLLKREVSTNLALRGGEVIVLGGLDEYRKSESRSSLPGLLSFFGSRSRDQARSELVLLIEATVVR